jgi:ATP-dependent DNA ligase
VLEFDLMQTRLHPAESRVRKLAGEIPATFIAFDVLLWDGEEVWREPLERRRSTLVERAEGITVSEVSGDPERAREWLGSLDKAGLDGVVAKRLGIPYLPGSRDGVVKVKERKTADCVVVGLRWSEKKPGKIATLLLGLYRDDGGLDYVGSTAVAPRHHDDIAARVTPLLKDAPERRFSEPNRWGGGELQEAAVRPEVVVEVEFDKVQGHRFRHGAKLLRFRADKDPEQCTWRELRPPRSPDDPSVESLLTAASAAG